MPHIEESINISRPLSEVFEFATNPANQTVFATNLLSYELLGPLTKGAVAQGVTRVAGKKVEWTAEITEFEQDRRMDIRSLKSPMSWTITWLFTPSGDGTEVRFVQDVPEIGGFFGRLADPIVTKMYSRDVRGNLEHLKLLLEESAAV